MKAYYHANIKSVTAIVGKMGILVLCARCSVLSQFSVFRVRFIAQGYWSVVITNISHLALSNCWLPTCHN